MRKLIFAALAAALLTGCATLLNNGTSTKNGLREARRNAIARMLDNRHYTIEADYAMPYRGTQIPLSYGYSLEISGDTIKSYLPYFGRAYNIPYGGGKGLNFTALINEYKESVTKHGTRHIELLTVTDEDSYLYKIDISDNGYASFDVVARERERISFHGEMSVSTGK